MKKLDINILTTNKIYKYCIHFFLLSVMSVIGQVVKSIKSKLM